jgi:hypothetical protein
MRAPIMDASLNAGEWQRPSVDIGTRKLADADRFGYPRGCKAVGTDETADAGRFDQSGRHQQTCRAEFTRQANGDSQWAGRS